MGHRDLAIFLPVSMLVFFQTSIAMKKYLLFLLLFLATIYFTNFTNSTSEVALQQVDNQFSQGLNNFQLAIDKYDTVARKTEDNTIHELQQIHLATRLAFKQIEFLLEYYDNYAVKKSINGAPLLTVEPKVAEVRVLEPVGLQVLDELIFADEPLAELTKIQKLVRKLKKDYALIARYQQTIPLTHRHIFEATRYELVRIFTLGLTGFDTPGSVNALPEAATAMKSLQSVMGAYTNLIIQKRPALAARMEYLFTAANETLTEADNFDDFDRLAFLKKYINPLFELTYQVHRALGIETLAEVNAPAQPLNYHATNLFANDFLNTEFYANTDLTSPTAQQRIALGKELFFEKKLSSSEKISCATCHDPVQAFTDGLPKSYGADGVTEVQRNSPTLLNAVYSERYFYDLRQPRLEHQIKHVVHDELEFATDFSAIVKKLENDANYQQIFKTAYADQPKYALSRWSVSDALASYVASLTSFNSPFDQYVRDEITELDVAAKRGFNLFMGKAACGTCHFAPTFNGTVPPLYLESESEVLGVPTQPDTVHLTLDPDPGRYASKRQIDQAAIYLHSFKTVTVRNVAETAPYMHNGVYKTLEQVVDFYNRGGGAGMGLDVPHQTLPDAPLNLTQQEQADLVAFMRSLSDNPFVD